MNDLLLGLLLFGVVLGFITLLGHGLWLLTAWFFRHVFGLPDANERQRQRVESRFEKCPGCWRPVSAHLRFCPACGLDRKNPIAADLQHLRITEIQVALLAKRGAMSQAAFEEVRQALDGLRSALLGRAAPERMPERRTAPAEEILEALPVDAAVTPTPTTRTTPPTAFVPVRAGPAVAITATAPTIAESRAEPPPVVLAQRHKRPRRSFGELLAGFMEERNILWGELVGGLLMVGCSIALVISLWTKLEQIPYFPFLIFAGITAALFGAGLYTLHHWKLESTSRGLLVIATLLVPLNFLVLAGLSKGGSADWIELATEGAALVLFTDLVRRAGRVLVPENGLWLTAAIMGIAATSLLTPRLFAFHEPEPMRFFLLGCVSVAFQVGCAVPVLSRAEPWSGDRAPSAGAEHDRSVTDRDAYNLFGFLGMTFFALAAALGFLVHWSGDVVWSLHRLAVPLAVAGFPILAVGLTVARGRRERVALSSVAVTLGTGVGLAGIAVLLVAVAAAWPQPAGLVATCVFDCAVLTWTAYRYRLPLVHAVSLACLGLAYVIGVHLIRGHITLWDEGGLAASLASNETGIVLAPFALVVAAVGEWLAAKGRRADRVPHATVAGVAAAVSLALVSLSAAAEPAAAALLSAIYAAATLALNTRWRKTAVGYVGVALILAATLSTLRWQLAGKEHLAVWGFVLGIEALLLSGLALVASAGRAPVVEMLASSRAWRDAAAIAGSLALLVSCWIPFFPESNWLTPTAAILAIDAVVLAWLYRRAIVAWVGAALLSAGSIHAVFWAFAGWSVPRPWLCAVIAPAALLVLGAFALRLVFRDRESSDLERVIVRPLRFASAVLCLACVPLLLVVERGDMGVLAWYAAGLAVLWCIHAWLERSHAVFAISQATLWWAVCYGVTAWLESQAWVRDSYPAGLTDVRSIHAYLAGLGLVSLLGVLARRWIRWLRVAFWADLEQSRATANEGLLGLLVGTELLLSVVAGALLPVTPWAAHLGSPLGWLALGFVGAAFVFVRARSPILHQHVGFALVLTALGLVAGNVEQWRPAWGSRLLMIGWGLAAPIASLVCWGRALLGDKDREIVWQRVAGLWAAFACAVTAALAAEAALARQDQSWAAAAMLLAGFGMAVLAIWQRRESWAFAAGVGMNVAVALAVWHFRRVLPVSDWWITLIQATTISTAITALVWLLKKARLYDTALNAIQKSPFLAAQIGLGLLGNAVLLALPFGLLLNRPGDPLPHEVLAVGNLPGWAALLLALGAALWFAELVSPAARIHLLGAFGISMGVWTACALDRWDDSSLWLGYHALVAVWALTALAASLVPTDVEPLSSLSLPGALRRRIVHMTTERRRPLMAWTLGIGAAASLLALRGLELDPLTPWWPAGVALAVAVVFAWSAIRFRTPLFVYLAGLVSCLAGGMIWYIESGRTATSLAATLVLCLSAMAGLWSFVEWSLRARVQMQELRKNWLPFSHAAVTIALVLLGLMIASGVLASAGGGMLRIAEPLTWIAVAVTLAALGLGAWDTRATFSRGALYGLGLGAALLALHAQSLPPEQFGQVVAPVLAGYALLLSFIGFVGSRTPTLRRLLPEEKSTIWFPAVQVVVGLVAVGLSVWIATHFPVPTERLVGSLAVALLVPAATLLAELTEREAAALRHITFALGVVFVVETGWALLDTNQPAIWLHRNIWLMLSLALGTVVYGVGLARLLPAQIEWWQAGRRAGPILGALATAVLLVILGQEGVMFDRALNRTPLAPAGIGIIAGALAVLIGAALAFALVPGRDPLGLSERGRMAYVYAAEGLLALTLLHFRLTVPELFHGWLVRYWTLIVMGVAFVGVGLGELAHRKGLRVLARPLNVTGIFLPLLPLIAFWLNPPDAWRDALLTNFPGLQPLLTDVIGGAALSTYQKYAVLWFFAGALYASVAMSRRSFRFAFIAALSANLGLWFFFLHHGYTFLVHPQMWLIPLALIVLTAEHINRDRLAPVQSAAIRYLALCMIYVSSTADMFIAGLGNSVALPLVLAVLAILGVLAGMLLRVRAFLFLGVAFLFVDIFSMIWHAAVDQYQTWVWWASGIVLGAAIIALFAVFEKRRNDVLHLVQQIKQWQ